MDYIVQGLKGNFGCFEGKQKGAITPKPERPHPPKLVCMHFTSSSTCINFLNRKGNLAVFESSNISEMREATPTKIGVHACYINVYLHEFFEPDDSLQ